MPFADYTDFDDCVSKNKDKDSPESYCATIHKKATGKWPSEKQSYHERIGNIYSELTRAQKAKALVDSGEAKDMKDAYAQLEDMGESVRKEGANTDFNSLARDVLKAQDALTQKAKKGGVWENFGQEEVRKLKDKYDTTKPEIAGGIEAFENWCMNYTGRESIHTRIHKLTEACQHSGKESVISLPLRAHTKAVKDLVSMIKMSGVSPTVTDGDDYGRNTTIKTYLPASKVRDMMSDIYWHDASLDEIGSVKENFNEASTSITKNFKEEDADPKELAMGIKVEQEHTDDPAVAKKIALDHLAEMPDYYTRLKKMEAGKKEGFCPHHPDIDFEGQKCPVCNRSDRTAKTEKMFRGTDLDDAAKKLYGKKYSDLSSSERDKVMDTQESVHGRIEKLHKEAVGKGQIDKDAYYAISQDIEEDRKAGRITDAGYRSRIDELKEQLAKGEITQDIHDQTKSDIKDAYELGEIEGKDAVKVLDMLKEAAKIDWVCKTCGKKGTAPTMPDKCPNCGTEGEITGKSIGESVKKEISMPKVMKVTMVAGDIVESSKWKLMHTHKGKDPMAVVEETFNEWKTKGRVDADIEAAVLQQAKAYMKNQIDLYGAPPKESAENYHEAVRIGQDVRVSEQISGVKGGVWGTITGFKGDFVELDMKVHGKVVVPKWSAMFEEKLKKFREEFVIGDLVYYKGRKAAVVDRLRNPQLPYPVGRTIYVLEDDAGKEIKGNLLDGFVAEVDLSRRSESIKEAEVPITTDNFPVKCTKCGWKGRTRNIDAVEETGELICPSCGEDKGGVVGWKESADKIAKLHKEMVFKEANELLMAQNASRDAIMQLEKEFKSKLSGTSAAKYVTTKVEPWNNGYRCNIDYDWAQHSKDVRKTGVKEDDKMYAVMDKYDQAFSGGFFIQPATFFDDHLAKGDATLEYNYGREYPRITIKSRDEIKPAVKAAQQAISKWIQGLKFGREREYNELRENKAISYGIGKKEGSKTVIKVHKGGGTPFEPILSRVGIIDGKNYRLGMTGNIFYLNFSDDEVSDKAFDALKNSGKFLIDNLGRLIEETYYNWLKDKGYANTKDLIGTLKKFG